MKILVAAILLLPGVILWVLFLFQGRSRGKIFLKNKGLHSSEGTVKTGCIIRGFAE